MIVSETRLGEALQGIHDSDDIVYADQVACRICADNLVLPLLLCVQSDGSQDSREEHRRCATLYLNFLVQHSHKRLTRAGWCIKKKGLSLGSYIYQHVSSGEQSENPQLMDQRWEHDLMQMLSLLTVHGVSAVGKLWAVKVQHHSVDITSVLTQLSELILCNNSNISRQHQDELAPLTTNTYRLCQWSIIDVLKFPEDDNSTSPTTSSSFSMRKGGLKQRREGEQKEEQGLQNSTIMRQLVFGPWRGPNSVAFSESCTQVTPGIALETWHETSIAGLGVLGLRQAERHMNIIGDTSISNKRGTNLLVLGAGQLANVINFIHTYHYNRHDGKKEGRVGGTYFNVVMVEEDRVLAEQALQLLNHPATIIKECGLGNMHIYLEGEAGANELDTCLHVASYSDFITYWQSTLASSPPTSFGASVAAGHFPSRLFDVILVGNVASSSLSSSSALSPSVCSSAQLRFCQCQRQKDLVSLLQPWGMAVLAGYTDTPHSYSDGKNEECLLTNRMGIAEHCGISGQEEKTIEEDWSSCCSHVAYVVDEMNPQVMSTKSASTTTTTTTPAGATTSSIHEPSRVVVTLLAPTVSTNTTVTTTMSTTSTTTGEHDTVLPITVALWDELFITRQEQSRTITRDTGTDDSQQQQLPLSMDVLQAQRTAAVRLPQLITSLEARQLHALAGRTAAGGRDWTTTGLNHGYKLGCEIRSQQSKLWEVLFLQSHGAFTTIMPELLQRVTERVIALDSSQEWGFQLAKGNFCLRVCEYHCQVAPSEALSDIHHYDQDSLVTVDIMLSSPQIDFTGADIETLEADGTLLRHEVNQYDALCFLSHKYHSVTPLLSGRRVVCVLEFWRGSNSPRTCPHRCLTVGQHCKLETQEEVAEEEEEENEITQFPFKLAAAQLCHRHREGEGKMRLVVLWQASDASDGVVSTREVTVATLDKEAVKQLDSMFGDDDSDLEEDSCDDSQA